MEYEKQYTEIYSEFIRFMGGWDRFNKGMRRKVFHEKLIMVNGQCALEAFLSNPSKDLKKWLKNSGYEVDKFEVATCKDFVINLMRRKYKACPDSFREFKNPNEDIDPLLEGITHINVYTKSKFLVGRQLSNLANIDITLPKFGYFKSLEGFWFWRITGMQYEQFRNYSGYDAKKYGSAIVKSSPAGTVVSSSDPEFREDIKEAIREKLKQHKDLLLLLIKTTLPLKHYYYHQGTKNITSFNVIDKSKHQWQLDEIERVRDICHKKMYEAGQLKDYPVKEDQLKRVVRPIFKR